MNDELGKMLYGTASDRNMEDYIRINHNVNGDTLMRIHLNAFLYDLLGLESLAELQQYLIFYCQGKEIDDPIIRFSGSKLSFATIGVDYASQNIHDELWLFPTEDWSVVNDTSYLITHTSPSKIYDNKYHIEYIHEFLVQKTLHTSTLRYLQEVQNWTERQINKWLDSKCGVIYDAIDKLLDQYLNRDAYDILSPLLSFRTHAYNMAHDYRVGQLIQTHPGLMFHYASRKKELDPAMLLLPVTEQLKRLCESNKISYSSLAYCLTKPELTQHSISRQLLIAEDHPNHVPRLFQLGRYDINYLRRLQTEKDWLLAIVISAFESAELMNLLIASPNLVEEYERLYGDLDDKKSSYEISSPLMLIRDAYNGLKDDNIDLGLRHGITLTNLRRIEDQWHERLRIRREMDAASRRQDIASNLVIYKELDFVDYVCESHGDVYNPNDVYCLQRIVNELELYDEGLAMNHCVHNYHRYCAKGEQCIYSMKNLHGKRIATIRLNAEDLSMLESRGHSNKDLIQSDKKRLDSLYSLLKRTPKPKDLSLDVPIEPQNQDFLALPLTNAI